MAQKDAVANLVLGTIKELIDERVIKDLGSVDLKTKLYGRESGLDSLALVALISEIEERAADILNVDINLADERAMSMTRSPFRTAESLTHYICELMETAPSDD